MSRAALALLEKLQDLDVRLQADGLSLRVDAPAGALTDELRDALREHKHALIRLLEREQRKLEEADRRGFVARWSRERGWISLHDPTTGDWHEVKASECLPSIVAEANARRRGKACST